MKGMKRNLESLDCTSPTWRGRYLRHVIMVDDTGLAWDNVLKFGLLHDTIDKAKLSLLFITRKKFSAVFP